MSSKRVVIAESNEQEIINLTKKWQKNKRIGNRLLKIGGSSFVVTLLSPFDFEGPIAEIITAIITAAGFILKEIAEYKLENLEEAENYTKKE